MSIFKDRVDAGHRLAQELIEYQDRDDVLVLALPRGGVPVAYQVAKELNVPLDIFLVRKLGLPGHEELAMGAIASAREGEAVRVLNPEVVSALEIPERVIDAVAARERQELDRRQRLYRGDRPEPDIQDKTVILVDDGLATGASMLAAVEGLRQLFPQHIVVAVPVAPPETCAMLERHVDKVVCAATPEPFYGVGLWYEDFEQTSDEEVRRLLFQESE